MSIPRYEQPPNNNDRHDNPGRYLRPESGGVEDYKIQQPGEPDFLVIPRADPVDVNVVTLPRGNESVRSWMSSNTDIAPGETYGIRRDDNRVSLIIRNNSIVSTDVVMLMDKNAAPSLRNGFPLYAGKDAPTIISTREVFIANPGATQINIAFIAEWVTELT